MKAVTSAPCLQALALLPHFPCAVQC